AAHFAHASFLSDQSTNPCEPTTTCCRRCRQNIVQETRFLGHNRQEPKVITRIPTHPRLHSSFKGPPPNHPPGRLTFTLSISCIWRHQCTVLRLGRCLIPAANRDPAAC